MYSRRFFIKVCSLLILPISTFFSSKLKIIKKKNKNINWIINKDDL